MLDASVEKAYDGKRQIHWCELYLGEKAGSLYDGDYFPAETLAAIHQAARSSPAEARKASKWCPADA